MAEEITSGFAALQLASTQEETGSSFAGLPAPYSPPKSCESIRSISGASSSYLSNISGWSSCSASTDAAELGADELHQGRSSTNKVSTSSVAEQLASVSEETTTGSTAPCPPSHSYRESIRSVAWPEWWIRSALSSQSGQSGSNYSSISGASSSSYQSNISGCSAGTTSAAAADAGPEELTKIACKMISDGYSQRMVQAFKYGGQQDHALETWFIELDISWVLQMREKYGYEWRYLLQDTSASSLQELVERWTRALTIVVVSIKELVAAVHETPDVVRFGKASISAMLNFVPIFDDYKVEKLQTIVHMYICVSGASYDMYTMHLISSDAQSIYNQEIGALLQTEENRLIEKLSSWMWLVKRKLMKKKHDDSWAIEIRRGRAEVHKSTRLIADCIVLMRKALVLTHKSAQIHNTEKVLDLIHDTIDYLKDLLLQKSKLCSDPSLGYLFLLNNICFAAQVSKPSSLSLNGQNWGPGFLSERQKYVDSYLDVSWGHVMSCISSSNFLGPLGGWINTSSLAKFQSAFHKTYDAQKCWKVSDPGLRSLLRKTITKRVISGYRYYLKEHPELEKQVSGGINSPNSLEEMLGELFEG